MAKGIYDLGRGQGYIYKVDVDGTTILTPSLNTPDNARKIKVTAVEAASVALNRGAYGTITVDTVTGVSSITDVRSPDSDMIDPLVPLAFTGATTTAQLATQIRDAINSWSPSLDIYTATVADNVVTVYADPSAGDSRNGAVMTVGLSAGNATFTIEAFNNGSDASELYDTGIGFRFFLDADYDAGGCAGEGTATPDSLANAVEITNELIQRGLNSAIDVQIPTISSGAISFIRKSVDTLLYIETQAAAATDDLDTITASGFANGDKVTIRGNNSGRVTTVKDGTGNIELEGNVDFSTGELERALTLQLKDSVWYEVSRTSQSIGTTSDYRTAGFGFFGVDEFQTQAIASSGTITFNGGSDAKFQEITGSTTLIGTSAYDLGTATNGDEFWLSYNATTTLSGNNLTIFGITLSGEQALNGGLIFYARYVEGSWKSFVSPNLDPSLATQYKAEIPNESITAIKLSSDLKITSFTMPVSWETDELGIVKRYIPFNFTVSGIFLSVSKTIEATDDKTLIVKNNSGTSMTGGQIDVPSGDPVGNDFTATPTANNTFTTGDVMQFETLTANPGGKAIVTVYGVIS